MSDNVIIFH